MQVVAPVRRRRKVIACQAVVAAPSAPGVDTTNSYCGKRAVAFCGVKVSWMCAFHRHAEGCCVDRGRG